ncbi:ARM repeat-containing protein [Neoconidiobolus thromboides FSU 785]|nr:ARM repeat-containing protein [Neoconidiobolus thromboides FSU 785]
MQAKEAVSQQKKTALLDCIRAVVDVQGNKLYNYMQTLWSLCLKLIRNSSETTTTRYAATLLLTSIIKSSNSSMDENAVKEIIKVCKSLLSIKSASFIIIGAECLEATILYCKNVPILYLNEELPLLIKYFEGANFSIRRAMASLISTMVAGSQASNRKILIEKPKKKLAVTTGGARGKNSDGDKDDINSIPTISRMLSSLSILHCKSNTVEDIRAGIFSCYITLFTKLGTSFVEGNYVDILRHIVLDLNPGPSYAPESPFDALVVRQRSNTLLREIGQKILSEQGQVHAAKSIIELLTEWIKLMESPELKSQAAGKSAVITMIDELSCLIQDLGDAAYAIQDNAIELLILLLETQGYSIQISSAWCLRNICIALPSFLPKLVFRFLTYLKNSFIEVMPLKKSTVKKAMGYGYALGSLISVSASAPQSVMNKLNASIFSIASQLLKSEGTMSFTVADPNIFQSQNSKIQVGWILIGSLMCLGPNYVRLILPQIILLFKAYLAKSSIKLSFFDPSAQMLTLSVTHSREHALQALYLFMVYNGDELAQDDIAQRFLPLLSNALLFYKDAANFISELSEKDKDEYITNIRKISESVNMIRKRALQSYSLLSPSTYEANFTSLSKNIVELLTVTSKTLNATSAWTDEDVVADWTGWAGSGYAMTSHFHRRNIAIDRWKADREAFQDDNNHLFEALAHIDQFDIDRQLLYPRFGAREFDPISLYLSHKYTSKRPNYFHTMTSTVISTHDAAVDLFAIIFPHLLPRAQTSILEKMVHSIKDKADLWGLYSISHCLFATLGALKIIYRPEKKAGKKLNQLGDKTISQIEEIIKIGLGCSDDQIRKLAAELLGFLCKNSNSGVVSRHIKQLVDNIINFADPDVRAGALLGLSNIHKFVGSATGNTHMGSVIQVMRTLCNDMHPLVHTHALEALATTINSVGHSFSPYIVDTLYIVFRLFLSENHQPGGTAYSKSLSVDHFLVRQNCGKVLNGIIGVLGPEIATNRASRFLCYGIMEQLKHDPEEMVVIEYLQCVHLVIMFDYSHIDLEFLVNFLCSKLQSVDPQLKRVAANCLYQLVQKSLQDVLKYAGPNLYEQLFQLLDSESELGEIVVVLNMLLSHSSVDDLPKWIDVIRLILTKHNIENVGSFNRGTQEGGDLEDEDGSLNPGQSIDTKANHSTKSSGHQGTSRWRTQLVALQILRRTFEMVQKSSTSHDPHPHLISRFGDLVKLAFAAATTPIEKISLEGYGILQDLLEQFKNTQDPHVPGSLLLEQYQAQIAAALAPAFNEESSPKVTASAIEVCAVFLTSCTGNAKTLSRIFKLMEKALNQCLKVKDSLDDFGDANFSSYESITVNLAVLKGWSMIGLSNLNNDELKETLDSNLGVLSKLWIKALSDYAYLKLDPKLLSMTDKGGKKDTLRITSGLDFINNSSSRSWLKPLYRDYWGSFLQAITHYLKNHNLHFIKLFAPDYPEPNVSPSSNFWVVYGLCMETLSSHLLTSNPMSHHITKVCLSSIRALFIPEITGLQILDKEVFSEMLGVFERFKYTHNLKIVLELVETLRSLVLNCNSDYFFDDNLEEEADNNVKITSTIGFKILKFYSGLLLGFLPNVLKNVTTTARSHSSEKLDLEVVLEINSGIYDLALKSPKGVKSNLCIIAANLVKHTLMEPYFRPINDRIISLLKGLVTKIESEDAINSILDSLTQGYIKNRAQNENVECDIIYNCLYGYTSLIMSLPNFINHRSTQILTYLISHTFINTNYEIKECGVKVTHVLIENLEAEDSKVSDLSKYCLQRTFTFYIKELDQTLLENIEKRSSIIEGLSNIFIELYSKVDEFERSSIAKLIISIMVKSTSYKECIPTVCKYLSSFASKYPEEFKNTVASLSPDLRSKLEAALRSDVLIEPSPSNQTAEQEFGDFEDNYEDEDDYFEDENDEFGDFDDGFNSDEDEFRAPSAPTIQLKDSFF